MAKLYFRYGAMNSGKSTSLLQAAMQQTYWLAANYFSTGRDTPPLGTAHSLIAPYQVFQARDGGLAGADDSALLDWLQAHPTGSADR